MLSLLSVLSYLVPNQSGTSRMSAVIQKISRLSPTIIRILGCNPGPMTLQGTNTYLIGTGSKRILIDTGSPNYPEYITNLQSVLKENNVTLQTILVTHWHADHVGGVPGIFQAIKLDSSCGVCKIRREEHPDVSLGTGIQYTFVNDGDSFHTEGATLKVVHTPGHTTDHMILFLREENALFSGDCVLGEGTTVFEDLQTYMESLKTLLHLSPTVIYPGHGPIIEDPIVRIEEYIRHRNQRENQILEAMERQYPKELSAMELVAIIYKDTPVHLYPAAANNVSHHLTKLLKDGKIEKSSDGKWSFKPSSNL